MEIIILPTANDCYSEAAKRISGCIQAKPEAVLGLATGRTMQGVYRKLAAEFSAGTLDFSRITTFNLDEYLGYPPDDPVTFISYMQEFLFRHINLVPKNIHIPSSQPKNVEQECARYEEAIRDKGGIDLQLLGLGREGHIGFNEPSSSLQARTRVKTLTKTTLKDNFGKETGPRFAITMGIGTIMEARQIILIALGEEKAQAVAEMVEGPITASCPASVLQFHPFVKVILDESAADKLIRKAYYQWVWEHKNEVEDLEL